ncbi:MAG: hypothetical protein SH850_18525 [Planctomycetaceae bacterium]|nr:hypothetical protein [Planctomycetaceae bacterium]
MKIVTCHRCWAWVPAQGEQCPECQHALNLNEADPSPAELTQRFGALVCRIAAVQIERRHLPQVGTLWGTSEGLLFVPELMTLADGSLADALEDGSSSGWNWWRLWRRPSQRRPTDWSDGRETTELVDIVAEFLNHPGAVFFARQEIVRLWNRGRTWTLQRSIGRTVKWTMLSPPEQWRPAWRQLFQTADEWRCVASP